MGEPAGEYYSVKLIYQATITGEPKAERMDEFYTGHHTFFEESVLLVCAQSFEQAYAIAERKARDNEGTHTNPYGQTVLWKLIDAVDCYLIGSTLEDGTELYSLITPKSKEITAGEYLLQTYGHDVEDYTNNEERQEENTRLQTVLTHEEFSRWRKPD